MARPPVLALLALLALAPYFIGLGESSIWDANEAFYVETPREMIEAGDYVRPTFNYEPRLNKPVLSYWIVAAAYRLLGVSVAAERLPMALAAVVIAWSAFAVARAVWSVEAGLWAAIVLATAPRVLMWARRIFIDIYLTMFMALVLAGFVLAETHPDRRRRWLLLAYVAAGLGMLTKGPVAVVLPALVFLAWLVWQRRLADLRRLMLPAGTLVIGAIVIPWYAALYRREGWGPIVAFFWGENIGRYTDAVAPARGPLFYLPVVFGDTFPWSVALVAAAIGWVRGWQAGRPRPLVGLLWLWLLVIVGVFSLSATKQDLYIFPAVVAAAALAGGIL
ncbi:MAG TPA: glycosyltransferase family 39 protein, partial [Vicinamibacterales bacterium]|nr:glycosyltransferase family 39 protein [Vicinamibacterales bacterium]